MPWAYQAISPSDLCEARRIFDSLGIPRSRIRFSYNDGNDHWELRDSDDDSMKADRMPTGVEWNEV